MTDNIRTRIEAAFNRPRPPPTNKYDELKLAVDLLTMMAVTAPRTPPSPTLIQSFREVGHATTVNELQQFEFAIEQLKKAVDRFHRPAIVRLADQGIVIQRVRGRVTEFVSLLPLIKQAKAQGPTGPAIGTSGRPRDNRAIATAHIVIDAYARIFGGHADLPAHSSGGMPGLLALMTEIFAVLGIKAQPAAALGRAVKELPLVREWRNMVHGGRVTI